MLPNVEHPVPLQHPAALSWTSTAPRSPSLGVSLDDVNQTLEIYLGSLYVNSFNEFGRYWQVTCRPIGRFRSRVDDINLLQVRNNQGQMVSLGTLVKVKDITGPLFIKALQPVHGRACYRRSCPASARATSSPNVDKLAAENSAASMKHRLDRVDVHADPGRQHLDHVFALAWSASFWPWPPSTKAGLCRSRSSWSVPLCVLCSLIGVLCSRNELGQHFRADRPGRAGRVGVQECAFSSSNSPRSCI